jgi:hypothetical protein
LTLKNGGTTSFVMPCCGQGLADHAARRDLGQLQAGRLRHERHGARGARVHFQHVHGVLHAVDFCFWIANCTFIRPTTFRPLAISAVWRFSSSMVSCDSE